jgi:hypothetical protein
LLFDRGRIENVASPEFKLEWLRTLRFIARKIARRKRRAGKLAVGAVSCEPISARLDLLFRKKVARSRP